jgi:hypothetical protein
MTESIQELQVYREQSQSIAMPEMDLETAVERFKQLGQFVKTIMRPDTDFGIIPGTPKPTLLKPGAEKLCTFFGLTKEEVILDKVMDWTGKDHGGEPFFYFHYQIVLSRNSRLVAEADGSANSWETKHRYRQGEYKCPKCGKETIRRGKADKGGGYYCWSKLGGCGTTFKAGDAAIEGQDVGKKKNPDPADLVNTIQKMAYKRALVAATLVAVNASEYFTQDIEDLPGFSPGASETALPQREPDISDRKQKAIDYLAKKGKTALDAERHLSKNISDWEQKDLDSLKAWAKAGFPTSPEPVSKAITPAPVAGEGTPDKVSSGGNTVPPRGITAEQLASLRKVPADLLDDAFMETGVKMVDLVELDYSAAEALLAWLAAQ